jgi:hypothetical protein
MHQCALTARGSGGSHRAGCTESIAPSDLSRVNATRDPATCITINTVRMRDHSASKTVRCLKSVRVTQVDPSSELINPLSIRYEDPSICDALQYRNFSRILAVSNWPLGHSNLGSAPAHHGKQSKNFVRTL